MSATGDGEAGFTLIEMLTVLTLTVMLGAMAFPSMERAMNAVAFVRARSILVGDLNSARAQAMSGGVPTVLTLFTDGGGYDRTGAAPRRFGDAIHIGSAGGDRIAFFPDGSARPTSLVLRGGARGITVRVEADGRVTPGAGGAG